MIDKDLKDAKQVSSMVSLISGDFRIPYISERE